MNRLLLFILLVIQMSVHLFSDSSAAKADVILVENNKTDQIANQGNAGSLQEEFSQLEGRWNILVGISIALFGLVAFMIYQRSHAQKKFKRIIGDKDDLIRIQREKLDQAKLELEIRMLKAQLNPDLLRNSLLSIQELINKKKNREALNYLTDLTNLFEKILPGAIKLSNSLDEEIQLLKLYIEMEQTRCDGSFSHTINIDKSLDKYKVRVPVLLLLPVVEYVMQPGSYTLGEKKTIALSFSEDDDLLQCEIKDHIALGNNSKKLNGVESRYTKSQALKISEQRIRLLAKKYNVDACIEYQNLSDHNGQFTGRSINIRLPIIREV